MPQNSVSRRNFVLGLGAGGLLIPGAAAQEAGAPQTTGSATPSESHEQIASRARRLAWWREAKFGMFIHWGLYSVIGHQEWVMESEGVPIPQYEILAKHFTPKPDAARDWARLAKRAGQKYMVMTAKHHEGFCMWDTKLTDYNAVQQGPKRDLVREFVDAARAEGLRVGLYYSLMDWHHPDGIRCATDPVARTRFVDYTHGLIRELTTNYGKIDILWYDVDQPLTPEQWRAEEMNRMVFSLQPDIIVNNRNGLPGDFSTPEHRSRPTIGAWETCDTMNLGWGYQKNDSEWKSPKTHRQRPRHLRAQRGQLPLNIGPMPDGAVPEESVRVLDQVGAWLAPTAKPSTARTVAPPSALATTTTSHAKETPSTSTSTSGPPARRPRSGSASTSRNRRRRRRCPSKSSLRPRPQDLGDPSSSRRTRQRSVYRLPATAPDDPVTVLAVECDVAPVVDHHSIRPVWPRFKVGVTT